VTDNVKTGFSVVIYYPILGKLTGDVLMNFKDKNS